MRKSGCAAQKRGFAEIDYKPRLFSQFQIKKVHRKIPSYGQLFYIECPKNGMLITALLVV